MKDCKIQFILNTVLSDKREITITQTLHMEDIEGQIVSSQIDYVLIGQRNRDAVMLAEVYPSAGIRSDHNPVIIKVRLKMKLIERKTGNTNINSTGQRDIIKHRFTEEINKGLINVKEMIRPEFGDRNQMVPNVKRNN